MSFHCKILRFLHILENPRGTIWEKHILLNVAQPHGLLQAVGEADASWVALQFFRNAAFGAVAEVPPALLVGCENGP